MIVVVTHHFDVVRRHVHGLYQPIGTNQTSIPATLQSELHPTNKIKRANETYRTTNNSNAINQTTPRTTHQSTSHTCDPGLRNGARVSLTLATLPPSIMVLLLTRLSISLARDVR